MKSKNILNKGFTLIELMIVVGLISLISAFAIPAYNNHLKSSRRLNAINDMLIIQLAEERYRATHTTYGELSDLQLNLNSPYYTYEVLTPSETSYLIVATAVSGTSQAKDSHDGELCTPLMLSRDNTRLPLSCWLNASSNTASSTGTDIPPAAGIPESEPPPPSADEPAPVGTPGEAPPPAGTPEEPAPPPAGDGPASPVS